jgi:hypothetical protein
MEGTDWPRAGRIELTQASLVATLIAVATLAWLVTHERMAGMDMGPGTELGSLPF